LTVLEWQLDVGIQTNAHVKVGAHLLILSEHFFLQFRVTLLHKVDFFIEHSVIRQGHRSLQPKIEIDFVWIAKHSLQRNRD